MNRRLAGLRRAAVEAFACSICMQAAWAGDLTIGGSAPTAVKIGELYQFLPQATAVGPLPAHFEIANAPPWATFATFDGSLTGIPPSADAGLYCGIAISITDGVSLVSLPTFSIVVYNDDGSQEQLSWAPPTQNDDGSPLTDLAGYNIYEGPSPDALTPFATADAFASVMTFSGLPPGTHYFAITTVNASSVESDMSGIVND